MQPRTYRILLPKMRLIISVLFFVIFTVGVAKLILWTRDFMVQTGLTPVAFFRLAFDTGIPLKESSSRTNVLVLGVGGGSHAGADLTDTIMVVSFDTKDKSMAMISIPRDIWSDTLKDRINSSFHYGEKKKKGGGMILAKAVIEDVLGIPIHYGLLIDFSGFEEIIDLVGGVTVNVPSGFTDPDFPIAGKEEDLCDGDPEYRCRYVTVTFEAGVQRMTGEEALIYVRSRHAQGDEGSDFARSRRQQDVLVSLKEKLLTPSVYLSPSYVGKLMEAFDKATETELRIGEFATLAKIVSRIKQDQILRISLEDQLSPAPLWVYGRYALVPTESWEALHLYIRSQLD